MTRVRWLVWAIALASVIAPMAYAAAPPPPGPVLPPPGPRAEWKICGKCNGRGVEWEHHRWERCDRCGGRGWIYDPPRHYDRHWYPRWHRGWDPGGCFVATAAFGTPWEVNVEKLRTFRDECLVSSPVGRGFVSLYYRLSPPMARWIAERPWARGATRVALTPAVAVAGALMGNPTDMVIVGGAAALGFLGIPRIKRALKRRRSGT